MIDQETIDFQLIAILATAATPNVEAFRLRGRMLQQCFVGKIVVQDHIGLFEALLPTQREQLRVARAGPDQKDSSCTCRRRHYARP